MRKLLNFIKYFGIIWGVFGILLVIFIVFNKAYFNTSFIIDTDLASQFGSFFGGFIGPIFTLLSLILIVYTIINQNLENRNNSLTNNFFKMIEYHNENVRQISISHIYKEKDKVEKGRRAFVVYKLQIKEIIEAIKIIIKEENLTLNNSELIDISYMIFFYGLEKEWVDFIKEKLGKYDDSELIIDKLIKKIEKTTEVKIGRTNQTNLSTYFRNMYNAIKLIDTASELTFDEKKTLIKIYSELPPIKSTKY